MAFEPQRKPGPLNREFLSTLTERLDGPAFIGKYLKLLLRGDRHYAVCPFHQDSKPSLLVRRDGSYYCFGCHKKGSVFNFLMEHSSTTFPEAVSEVAQYVGVPMPARSGQSGPTQEQQTLYDLLERSAAFFQQQLASANQNTQVKQYLQHRQIDEASIQKYRIGFAPNDWRRLKQHFQGTDEQLLINADVLVRQREQQDNVYDRYRNRLMFPIRNRQGNVVGFGGRVLDENDNPKYLNTKQTSVFHKSRELYGLFELLAESKRPSRILLVEGYTDVVGLSQHGVSYAVAALGTASNDSHFRTMFWFTDEVVCCFDGDDAGRTAAQRALDSALPALTADKSVSFLFLPAGEDPDSFIRTHGKAAFEQLVDEAPHAADYVVTTLVDDKETALETVEEKSNFIDRAKALISKIKNSTMQQVLAHEIAKKFPDEVSFEVLLSSSASAEDEPPPFDDFPPPAEEDYPFEMDAQIEENPSRLHIHEITTRRRLSHLLSAPNIWPLLKDQNQLFERLVDIEPNDPLTRIWMAINQHQFKEVNALIAFFQDDEWFTRLLLDIHNETVAAAMIDTPTALRQFTDSVESLLTAKMAQIEQKAQLSKLSEPLQNQTN